MRHNKQPRTRQLPKCACGCGVRIGPVAFRHGDPYATSTCCRRHLGVEGWKAAVVSQALSDKMAQ